MTAAAAAAAMETGVRAACEGTGMAVPEVVGVPMADGGEGFTEVIARALDAELRTVTVPDALGREVRASFAYDPAERLAVHVCRGNWTPDETKALAGDYRPLTPLLAALDVHTLVLELGTSRAGELEALAGVRDDQRIGVGVYNQKNPSGEDVETVLGRARRAVDVFGRERVLLNTDCGFATFADNPILAARQAEEALAMLARVRDELRA